MATEHLVETMVHLFFLRASGIRRRNEGKEYRYCLQSDDVTEPFYEEVQELPDVFDEQYRNEEQW